jgi:hypothetical protein
MASLNASKQTTMLHISARCAMITMARYLTLTETHIAKVSGILHERCRLSGCQ